MLLKENRSDGKTRKKRRAVTGRAYGNARILEIESGDSRSPSV
jgi:hypothetical protein